MKKLPSPFNLRNSRKASKSCLHSNNLRNLRNLREIIYILAICGSLSLTSCSHTRYIPMPSSHSRDSLSKSVNVLVNTTYVDRTHTESFLHGTTTAQKTTDWGLSLISSFRVDTLVVKDSIYVEKFTDVEVHDTITVTIRDSIPHPVEVPVEVPMPIPRIYKNCTIGFFLLLLAIIAYIALRIFLHR